MSISRISRDSSKASRRSPESTRGSSLYAHLYTSMFACRHPGCSISRCVRRVGRIVFIGTACGWKKRKASKCVHVIRWDSTTSSVPAAPSRRSRYSCRCPLTSER